MFSYKIWNGSYYQMHFCSEPVLNIIYSVHGFCPTLRPNLLRDFQPHGPCHVHYGSIQCFCLSIWLRGIWCCISCLEPPYVSYLSQEWLAFSPPPPEPSHCTCFRSWMIRRPFFLLLTVSIEKIIAFDDSVVSSLHFRNLTMRIHCNHLTVYKNIL